VLPRSTSAYLAARAQFGIKFGLESMHALLAELERPEAGYPSLLVAGTNGKGSVVAYVDAALRAAGLRVGRYTSPHLVRVNERIAVNGRAISDAALARAVGRVRGAARRLQRAGRLAQHPTYFEVLTAAAFEHFRRARVEVAVLEVGMGARLDATNAKDPLASAIVTLARDHEAYLGRTLAAIAREKAGVLRPGRVTVLGALPAQARRSVEREARRRGARLLDAFAGVRLRERGERVDLLTPHGRYLGVRPLAGAHQRHNLVVAVRLLEAARGAGLRFELGAAAPGLSRVRWPGRLQWLEGDPPLLLDGAHNPAGARALADHLRGLGPFVLLFGMMRDKNAQGLARRLFPLAREVVVTRPPLERAAAPERVARAGGRWARRLSCEPSPGRALALARRRARGVGPVVVAGSLYLVGDVLRRAASSSRATARSRSSASRSPRAPR
jgi:dihydrofolate synthase/folylpolyglutamate synthase